MNSQLPPNLQPAYIRIINRVGQQLESAGFSGPHLNADRLVSQARKKTGLQNFGDDSFRVGLEKLTTELRDHARLSQIGRLAAHFNLLDHLCVRLRLIDYRLQRPEVAKQQIKQPLFIMGLPRTGTTILHELIAQDPAMRSPTSWEVARPFPPATPKSYESDRRMKSVDRMMALAEMLSPGFRAIHAIGARLPQECVYLLALQFVSEQFGYMYNIPAYRAWALNQDMTESYRWHENFLQHLQVDYGRERWVLKTPSHLAYLQYLLARYPDANIVWTHRQPIDAIASFSSLVSTLHSGFSDRINRMAIGTHEFKHFAKIVHAGMEQRDQLDQAQFLDVGFDAICANPMSVIRGIYDHFDMPLGDDAETRMHEYLSQRPRNLYGEHRYSAGEYGLDQATESRLYLEYITRFSEFLD